ncbi:MAG: BMP family ABC transporter substrate-binding protein, partial [Clostridia bacterium]|nr:BMP family ABC transporter substrate-binding protein [Clostridia bacterium]
KDENGKVKIGYIGAFTYAEVMSGYTSFFLGVKSEYENVSMMVQFTGSWYDETEEKNAAQTLIGKGCALISQHADSMGAPSACEDKGIPNVSYNGSTVESCPNTFIISSRIDWSPYVQYICKQTQEKKAINDDFVGTLSDGSVKLTAVNEKAAAAGTQDRIDAVKAELVAGTRKVFDTANFTVGGEHLTSYKADVDSDENMEHETEAIADGYFHESEKRSAPYFDIRIDDITLLNEKY